MLLEIKNKSTSPMISDKLGLQRSNHLRGVMPLVLFWNFSGDSSWKSLNLQWTIK